MDFGKLKSDLDIIVNTDFDTIKSTDLVLTLIRLYSKLFLNSNQIDSTCVLCLEKYHNEIKSNGYSRLEKMQTTELKTNKCKLSGLKYIAVLHVHYDLQLMNDREATNLLKIGYLKESDFEVLPENWAQKNIDKVDSPAQPSEPETNIEVKKSKKTKNETIE